MATTKPIINYFSRDFDTLRSDLISYVKNYHSDRFKFFNPASPDMMYLELLAYIGDGLNFQIDRSFNEAFRPTAQSRESLIRIAQDLGFYNYSSKPSSTQITASISVPAIPNANGSGMTPDSQYLFSINPGMIVQSDNGSIFECLEEINFSQAYNRTIIPNYDSNGLLLDYTVNKTAVVLAGETKIQRFYVSQNSSKPFLEIILDDEEVTEVLGVVVVAGNSFDVPVDSDFRADSDNVYVEVENLAEDKIFLDINPIPEDLSNIVNAYTDMTISYGEWINKPKRFIVRRDKNNITSIIFGSTLVDYSSWDTLLNGSNASQLVNFSLNQILNNKALGEVPPIDTTLFIKFRRGAGVKTNVLTNSIKEIVSKQFSLQNNLGNLSTLEQVKNSLTIKSNLPAIGGVNAMSNEEIRNSVGKIFAANDRAVTYEDVKALINKMPAKFGQPFRISYEEIKPQILNYTQIQNYVTQQLDSVLTAVTTIDRENVIQNIKNYLTDYPAQIAATTNIGQQITLGELTNGTLIDNNTLKHKMWFGEKCKLHILGIDENLIPTTIYKDENNVWRSPNELLKQNIKSYLSTKRVIGDWIDIVDAKIVNIQVDFKVLVDKKNKQKVLIDCLTRLRDYFSVYNWQINQPIFLANISTVLQEIEGVINVVSVSIYNIFDNDITTGKSYSPKEIGRYKYLNSTPLNSQNNKFECQSFNNVIVSDPSIYFNVKYPDSDISGTAV
ncbi:MAG: hypothetical protein ABIP51_17115 [Bacteroidia bacterium]